MMERAALLEHLEFFVSNEDVQKPKPDPEMYITAASRLGLRPDECLIIEDNDHGVQAAVSSGGHVLRVATVNDVTYQRITSRIEEIEQGLN
jgi:HAD superfamily hydrolase (TIGR01509 family)